jgi:hypothetical protein
MYCKDGGVVALMGEKNAWISFIDTKAKVS